MARSRQPSSTLRPGGKVVEQHWDPARYQRNAGFVAALGAPLLELLAPRAGERILDLGCGDGALTQLIAAHAHVTGVDASPEQVAAARARGLDAAVADGTRLAFGAVFDAVFSNAALHWMRDPDAVIAAIWRALKPGGRFVAECGGAGNVESVRRALAAALARRGGDAEAASPWYFPEPAEYRARLERQGFVVASMALIPRPTPLPGTLPTGSTPSRRVFLPPFRRKRGPWSKRRSRTCCAAHGSMRRAFGRSTMCGCASLR